MEVVGGYTTVYITAEYQRFGIFSLEIKNWLKGYSNAVNVTMSKALIVSNWIKKIKVNKIKYIKWTKLLIKWIC